jgi:hypothetical protein
MPILGPFFIVGARMKGGRPRVPSSKLRMRLSFFFTRRPRLQPCERWTCDGRAAARSVRDRFRIRERTSVLPNCSAVFARDRKHRKTKAPC